MSADQTTPPGAEALAPTSTEYRPDTAPQQPAQQGPTPFARQSASLYVGDLKTDVTESQLYDVFRKAGTVASIRVCRDATSKRSLGYAYVNFHNSNDAENAISSLNFTRIQGKPCRVMWSYRDPSRRRAGVGNLFVKNLPPTVDNQVLHEMFSKYGNILSCKVETDDVGVSKGYGFVHYETDESAMASINALNDNVVNGKPLFVGPFVPRKERPVDSSKEQKFTNIYVKNLEKPIDEAQLKEAFGKFGEITSCVVMRNASQESRGFGFINFSTHEAAFQAVKEMNQSVFGGKNIYAGRAQSKFERSAELKKNFSQPSATPAKQQGVNLFIKNLEDAIEDEELRTQFSTFGTITSAKVMRDDKLRSKGFGFVCFSTPEEAAKAVNDMNGFTLHGKPIYVALAQKKDQRRAQLQEQYQRNIRFAPVPNQYYLARMPQIYTPPLLAPRGPTTRWGPRQPQPMPPMFYPYPAANTRPQRPQMQRRPMQQAPMQMPGAKAQDASWSLKFSAEARNQPIAPPQQVQVPVVQVQQQQEYPQASQQAQLSSELANLSPEDQRQLLGEKLYPHVQEAVPDAYCGKITGMLLDSLQLAELVTLLENPDVLRKKVTEAQNVLEEHMKKQGDGH